MFILVEKSTIFDEICKMLHLFAGQHVRNMAVKLNKINVKLINY